VRIWVDLTAPAHPIVFRPIVARLRAAGHDVHVTARDYAQTLALARRHGLDAHEVGHHGGASRVGKLGSLAGRTSTLLRWARGRRFDVALAHGSNDLALVARMLRIPAANTFDYEFATVQHNIGCRFARRVVVPDAIPPERLSPYGVGPEKLRQYPGLKEDYYLADFEPDAAVLDRLAVDRRRVLITVRPPPDVSLYHRKSNPLFPQVLAHIGHDPDVHAVVLPRTEAQRATVRALGYPSLIVPDGAEDGQSLVALADVVISAGGTMNREAVALGTPVYTTYGGRLGGVDEQLIRDGRLRPLTDPRAIELRKRDGDGAGAGAGARVRRDPQLIADLLMGAAA
jgi:predicted glycosyltransferase